MKDFKNATIAVQGVEVDVVTGYKMVQTILLKILYRL